MSKNRVSWSDSQLNSNIQRRIGGADGNKGNKDNMAEDDTQGARLRRRFDRGLSSVAANDNNTNDATDAAAFRALVDRNDQMGKEVEYLRNRLNELEIQQQQQQQQQRQQQKQQPQQRPSRGTTVDSDADADSAAAVDGEGNDIDTANNNDVASPSIKRGIKWRDPMIDKLDNGAGKRNDDHDDDDDDNVKSTPPIGKIKFLDRHIHDAINVAAAAPAAKSTRSDRDDDTYQSSSSVESSEEGEVLAFSGEARVFFQARHHRSATQIVPGTTTTSSQDTYLRVAVVHSADANGKYRSELRIFCAARDHVGGVSEPPVLLIDPPIPLKHFYAAKVPGSHSGAALFLRNDPRRLRRYIWRFEFANRAVRQPPSRYLQFARSGRVARKSMVRRPTLGMAKRALRMKPTIEAGEGGEGGGVGGGANSRARDAFAVHLSALDELLRESDEAADGFVEFVNSFNDAAWEEEVDERVRREFSSGGGAGAGRRRSP